MLKLTKYELRKNLLGIGIVAGIICVLQALFMFFWYFLGRAHV